jgi:Domain of unknown function (DUF5666)
MRRFYLVLAVTALVAAGWPTTQALAQDSSKTRGTISSLSGDSVTVKVRDQEMKFRVDAKTVVEARGAGTKDRAAEAAGKAGPKLSEVVKTGDAVEVTYVDAPSGALRATHIRSIVSVGNTGDAKPSEMVSNGVVKSVTATALSISGSLGSGATFTQSFTIDPSTKVVAKGAGTAAAAKGGKLVLTDAVAVGDRVSISYHEGGGALQASEVRVLMKAGPKT